MKVEGIRVLDLALFLSGSHQQPVIDFLQGVFATKTQAEWIEWFRCRDVCFAPVKRLRAWNRKPSAAVQSRSPADTATDH